MWRKREQSESEPSGRCAITIFAFWKANKYRINSKIDKITNQESRSLKKPNNKYENIVAFARITLLTGGRFPSENGLIAVKE
uniref:Thioredoxin H-type-like n=1 Tax=Rhizophora mucronata TaxID=61149 RepID=A0A2P2LZN0_RHIMU